MHGDCHLGVDEQFLSLVSAADDITALIICNMLSTAPLLMGMSSLLGLKQSHQCCWYKLRPRAQLNVVIADLN
jgi:hypothetical protein